MKSESSAGLVREGIVKAMVKRNSRSLQGGTAEDLLQTKNH